MKFVETAVDIQRCIEARNTEKLITKFCLFSVHLHVNLCPRANCKVCKFVQEYLNFCCGVIILWIEKFLFFTGIVDRTTRNFVPYTAF